MPELTDEQIREHSRKDLEERADRVRQAIRSTLSNAYVAREKGEAIFCVGWGLHLWYVCDETDVIDGPFSSEEAHKLRDRMNLLLKEAA